MCPLAARYMTTLWLFHALFQQRIMWSEVVKLARGLVRSQFPSSLLLPLPRPILRAMDQHCHRRQHSVQQGTARTQRRYERDTAQARRRAQFDDRPAERPSRSPVSLRRSHSISVANTPQAAASADPLLFTSAVRHRLSSCLCFILRYGNARREGLRVHVDSSGVRLLPCGCLTDHHAALGPWMASASSSVAQPIAVVDPAFV